MAITWNNKKFKDSLKKFDRLIMERGKIGVERAIENVRGKAVGFTPVKTGRLKASIQGSAFAQVITDSIEGVTVNRKVITGKLGTNVPYAKKIEYGTSTYTGRRMLGRAFYHSRAETRAIIFNSLKD